MRGAELGARVHAAILATQPLAVEQVRAGELGPQPGAAQPLDRLAVQAIGDFAVARQRSRTRQDPEPPVGGRNRGDLRQRLECSDGELCPPDANGGLDQLRARPAEMNSAGASSAARWAQASARS